MNSQLREALRRCYRILYLEYWLLYHRGYCTIVGLVRGQPRAARRGRGVSHWRRRRPRLVAGGGGIRLSIISLSISLSIISLSIRLSVSLSVSGVAVYDGAEGRLIPVGR